jgi:hypothetical protein
MANAPVSFQQKFALFSEQWKPKVVAEMNDYQFKIVRLEGSPGRDFLGIGAARRIASMQFTC